MLTEAIAAAKAKLAPVTDKQLMVGINRLLQHARTFAITVDAKALAETYRLMCATMPADLFERGLIETLTSATDTFRLPMPGKIWDAVRPEYDRRTRELGRLETAMKFGKFEEPVPESERVSRAETDRVVAEALKALGSARAA